MTFRLLQRRRREFATSLLLVALLFKAYIPLGFMPASGTPFLLKICPMGMQLPMSGHQMHHPTGGHDQVEDCPFGSAPAFGPISHFITFEPAGPIVAQTVVAIEALPLGVRPQRAHLPRGPPFLT